MAQLNNFVSENISKSIQHTRDFEGSRGWVALANQFLSKLERLRMYDLGRKKEIGIEVFDDYWIAVPSDLRKVISVYRPYKDDKSMLPISRHAGFVNGKIKLRELVTRESSNTIYSLMSGTAAKIDIVATGFVEDDFNDYLLVVDSYNPFIIKKSYDTFVTVTQLDYLHTPDSFPVTGSGYLTDQYVMLKYQSSYTRMVNYDDEIPIDDKYEDLLKNWLWYNSLSITDKARIVVKREFEEDLDETLNEQLTLSAEEMQVDKQELVGFNYYEVSDFPSVEA